MTHSEIIWNILSSLAILLGILATYLKSRSERQRFHADTSSKLATPSGDTIGEVAERAHDMAALAAVQPGSPPSAALEAVVERVNSDPKSPVQVNGAGTVEGKP